MATTRDPYTNNPYVTAPTSAPPAAPPTAKSGPTRVDAWMNQEVRLFGRYFKRKKITLWIMGAPAFLPIIFTLPAMITQNGGDLNQGEADVLGTGSEILLLLTLLITPLATMTGQRWFVPLRKWYGVMLAINATFDGITASITGGFAGGPVGRVAGHSFLLIGLVMIMILIPLALISNNRSQRWLGKHWKPLQKLTYLVWALLFVHLALLFGLGYQQGLNGSGTYADGIAIFHQRFYQLAACSLFLFLLRLGPVRRWVTEKRAQGQQWVAFWALLPVILLFCLSFAFILHEEFFKGIDLFRLNPSNE